MTDHSIKIIESYVHDHRIGVLVEFGMTADATSRVPEVADFMKSVALHIAAFAPKDIDQLLSQAFVKDPDKLTKIVLKELTERVSEEISILRFVRWNTGEESDKPLVPPTGSAKVLKMADFK